MTIKCTQCQQTHNDEIYFTVQDEVEIPGSRGTANFLMTCQFCKKNKLVVSLDSCSPL